MNSISSLYSVWLTFHWCFYHFFFSLSSFLFCFFHSSNWLKRRRWAWTALSFLWYLAYTHMLTNFNTYYLFYSLLFQSYFDIDFEKSPKRHIKIVQSKNYPLTARPVLLHSQCYANIRLRLNIHIVATVLNKSKLID